MNDEWWKQFSNRELISLVYNDMRVEDNLYHFYIEKDIKILKILLDRLKNN